jgi:hypothetical protein
MNLINKDIYNGLDLLPFDLQGWNGKSELFTVLIEEVRPTTIFEVGTWKGQSAVKMGEAIKQLELDCTIVCIDTWLGSIEFWDEAKHTSECNLFLKHGYPSVYYQFLSNVVHSKMQDIIIPFPTTSLIAGRFLKKQKKYADLIYIDGSHEYEDVLSDLTLYWDLLNENGIVFGDDFVWRSVRRAVEKFTKKNHLPFQVVVGNYWMIKKIAKSSDKDKSLDRTDTKSPG